MLSRNLARQDIDPERLPNCSERSQPIGAGFLGIPHVSSPNGGEDDHTTCENLKQSNSKRQSTLPRHNVIRQRIREKETVHPERLPKEDNVLVHNRDRENTSGRPGRQRLRGTGEQER